MDDVLLRAAGAPATLPPEGILRVCPRGNAPSGGRTVIALHTAVRRRPVGSALPCMTAMSAVQLRHRVFCADMSGWADAMKTIYRTGMTTDAITIEHWPSWAGF